MSKRWIWLLALVCCSGIAGLALAQGGPEFDPEAAAAMSKKDRLIYQQEYKINLEKTARENGWVPPERAGFKGSDRQVGAPSKALGTITYHSGLLGTCCTSSKSVGNQFNFALNPAGTAIGPVMMSGSITMATFSMANVGGGAVFFSVFDGAAGTAANPVSSFSVPASPGVNNFIMVSPIGYSGSSFLAGIWQFTAGSDTPNVATGTVGGQGFHGMSINDIVGTGFTTLSTLNGALAVGGDVLTPVELLNFDVE